MISRSTTALGNLGRIFVRCKGTTSSSLSSAFGSLGYAYYDLGEEIYHYIETHEKKPAPASRKDSGSGKPISITPTDSRKDLGRKKRITASSSSEGKLGRVFEGNYTLENLTPEQRIAKVFGTRLTGADRESSSRIIRGEPRIIAGIKVPEKPTEPDNCCMSGCINCVWELYNDDVKEWKLLRHQAAQRLTQRGGRWPENFHAPVKLLKKENLPASLELKYYGTSSDDDGSPVMVDEEDGWGNIPVSIQVFAEMEKKLKAKKRAKAA